MQGVCEELVESTTSSCSSSSSEEEKKEGDSAEGWTGDSAEGWTARACISSGCLDLKSCPVSRGSEFRV